MAKNLFVGTTRIFKSITEYRKMFPASFFVDRPSQFWYHPITPSKDLAWKAGWAKRITE